MPYKDPEKNKEYQREWSRKRHQENRIKAFDIVGDVCAGCGIDDKRVLEFDHIKPILRRTSGFDSGNMLARDILTGKIAPELIQVLCANCHTIKTYHS